MPLNKTKRLIFLILGIILSLLVITISVLWIIREIRWKNTRRDMDVMEHEILQKIVITENERLPDDLTDELYTSIMAEETESDDKSSLVFEALTKEFIKRINTQLNIFLKPNDLKSKGYPSKSDIEKYGNTINIAYYEFGSDEERYFYHYYVDGRMTKSIHRGSTRVNFVSIINENNERLSAVYSDWENKYNVHGSKPVSMNDYFEFMKLWEKNVLPKDKLITIKNIQNIYIYKSYYY